VKRDRGAWSIPKGECADGEDAQLCALREFAEELGSPPMLAPESLIDLGEVRQKGGKLVRAWAAEGDFDPAALHSNTFILTWPAGSGRQREFPEIDRAAWFVPEMAVEKLNPAQTAFVERLLRAT
jgi:predicted NUDIX family NTP pyrophosphohydrolase